MRNQPKRSNTGCAIFVLLIAVSVVGYLNRSSLTGESSSSFQSSSGSPSSARTRQPTQADKPTTRPKQTPEPTAKPTAKPTPQPLEGTLKTTANFRSGPSTDSDILAKLKEGSSIQLFSKLTVEDALWYRAYSAEQEGWVSGSVLNVDSETVDKVPDQLQTPALFITIPPQGAWCEESESTFICAYNFRYPTKIGYQQVAKNARAIAMGIQVKNTSSDDIYVNPNDFTIVLEDGRSYTYAPETYTYWDVSLQAITISPGDKVTGGLLFLVPNDVGIERIISRSTFGETVTIDLRKPPRP